MLLFCLLKQGVITSPETATRIDSYFPKTNPFSPSKADTLKKLHDLRQAGALTDEEFEAEKRKILG